jgi:pyruvate dehydrogenase E2 component (dihydrolipoamide acetyltransferase)
VPVDTPLANVLSEGEEAGETVASVQERAAPAVAEPAAAGAVIAPPVASAVVLCPEGRVRASPAARRLAQERGVDLISVIGSGPGGAVLRADVERQARSRPKMERAVGLNLDAMRAAIATAMARSKREIPHYYLQHDVDVTASEIWLAQANAARPPDRRLLMGALTVKAVAVAVQRHPAFNGFCRDGRFEPASAIHVGVAIAVRGGGLAAPAIHDADRLSLDQLMAQMRDLVQRTRAGRIRSSEIADPTITVSSLGERGVDALYGVIYPPQVAIVGFGKAVVRPWIVDGKILPRSMMIATLSADHRTSDGHAGALFLAEIGRILQEPDKL